MDGSAGFAAYGERWAMYWMDLARYSDTRATRRPAAHHVAWRDWVIHAFNTNLPYDRFVTEQRAT